MARGLETGLIGQALYLEAEAAGLRGTGIGCFFDDSMHEILGLKDNRLQAFIISRLGALWKIYACRRCRHTVTCIAFRGGLF